MNDVRRPSWWSKENEAALLVGAQGPDMLFFYHLMPPLPGHDVNRLGGLMHRSKTDGLLCAIAKGAQASGSLEKAWALGFVSHVCADATMHPFVFAHSMEKGAYNGSAHLMLEKAMDTWLYRDRGNSGIPKHMNGVRALSGGERKKLAAFLSGIIAQVYDECSVNKKQVERSFNSARRIARLLYSPSGKKYKLFGAIGKIIGNKLLICEHMVPVELLANDFLNQENSAWFSPWEANRERRESVPELCNESIAVSAKKMRALLDYFDDRISMNALREVLGKPHLQSGLDWDKTDDTISE